MPRTWWLQTAEVCPHGSEDRCGPPGLPRGEWGCPVSRCHREQLGGPAAHGESRGAQETRAEWPPGFLLEGVSQSAPLELTEERTLGKKKEAWKWQGPGSSCVCLPFGHSSSDTEPTPPTRFHPPTDSTTDAQVSFFFFPVGLSDYFFHPLRLFPAGWTLPGASALPHTSPSGRQLPSQLGLNTLSALVHRPHLEAF